MYSHCGAVLYSQRTASRIKADKQRLQSAFSRLQHHGLERKEILSSLHADSAANVTTGGTADAGADAGSTGTGTVKVTFNIENHSQSGTSCDDDNRIICSGVMDAIQKNPRYRANQSYIEAENKGEFVWKVGAPLGLHTDCALP
jgi:hypothetical protein